MRVCAGCANRNEATAFADAENEYLIHRALDILLHGKTVLMIAHRLQTIVHADQIIVMQRGGIAEQGTHEELMQRQGVYAKMYHEYENSVSWKIGGYANKKIEELDTRRQTISKAIAELSVETISPQQIKKLSYYLDNCCLLYTSPSPRD